MLRLPAGYLYLGGLSLSMVAPGAGPEEGGLAVQLDGAGFAAGARVWFGPQEARSVRVHPGGNRISCVTPPGTTGTVDVTVVQGPQRAVLKNAFTYLGRLRLLAIDPPQGSIAGGTWVRLIGTGLAPGLPVLFGASPAQDVTWHSSTLLTMRAPRAEEEGTVDVQIPGEGIVPGGYTYYDPFSGSGGVWGDPVEGSMNVAIFDSYTGDPVAGAVVILGPDADSPWRGTTDERGLVTIAGPTLVGPVDVHAGAEGYEPGSFLHTNGCNASFYLVPFDPPTSGGGGGQVEQVDGTISGFLSGLEKYIPRPTDPDWERVAYVKTTQDGIYGRNPDPGPGGTLLDDGPYSIASRPGDVAVVAVGGLHNLVTKEFIPLRMGVYRYVFMPIRGTVDGANVVLDIRLDHRMGVRLLAPPYDFELGPDELSLRPWLEFQPEGYYPGGEVKGSNREFWIEHLPVPGSLSMEGVQLDIETGLYTRGTRPYSVVWTGNVPLEATVIDVGPFVGIPRLTYPTPTRALGDYLFNWTIRGETGPDVSSMRMLGPSRGATWRIILPGPLRSFRLPYLPGVFEIPEGRLWLSITAGRAPVFSMDAFEYRHLSVRAWDSWSLDYADFLVGVRP